MDINFLFGAIGPRVNVVFIENSSVNNSNNNIENGFSFYTINNTNPYLTLPLNSN